MQCGVRLTTRFPICVIALQAGMSARAEIVRIPEGSIVSTLDESDKAGMMVVEWSGRRYAMFVTDLDERCAPLPQAAMSPANS